MKLPKHLIEKRDELGESSASEFYHAQGDIQQVMPWSDCKESFQKGFDAGVLEVLKEAEKLVEALKEIVAAKERGCVDYKDCQCWHEIARESISEWQKWEGNE